MDSSSAARKTSRVRIVEPEADSISVFQRPLGDLLAVDEDAAAMPAILKIVAALLGYDCRALARDALIGNRQVVSRLAAANEKRRLAYAHTPTRTIGGNDLESSFTDGWDVRHKGYAIRRLYHGNRCLRVDEKGPDQSTRE